jgi:hypothetical protein
MTPVGEYYFPILNLEMQPNPDIDSVLELESDRVSLMLLRLKGVEVGLVRGTVMLNSVFIHSFALY